MPLWAVPWRYFGMCINIFIDFVRINLEIGKASKTNIEKIARKLRGIAALVT
jgi:hypothetical protein